MPAAPVRPRRLAPSALVALSLMLAGAPPAQAEDFESAHRVYQQNLRRPSLRKRCEGRERLALTGDDRALEVLAADYAKPEAPRGMVRSMLVILMTDHFGSRPDHLDHFAALRERHDRPEDAYLWYRTLLHEIRRRGPAAALAAARAAPRRELQAAALEALAVEEVDEALTLIPEILAALPRDPVERALLVEALARYLSTQRARLTDDALESPAHQLFDLLDEKETLPRTRYVLSRCFGRLFDTDDRFVNASGWRGALHFVRQGGKEARDDGYARPQGPTFAGLEATGDRIVYVIDMSDSMLQKLAPEILEKLPRGPVTGTGGAPADAKKRKGPFADSDLVDWRKVRTRFDAAREMLKLSLTTLPPDKHFAVVFFGTDARLMGVFKGLQPATPSVIKKTIKELDGIKPGPPTADRTFGQLRGHTNLHGGLLRAFQCVDKGLKAEAVDVDPEAILEGTHTIFLLSDGRATWDDWALEDTRDPHDRAGNPETGAAMQDQPTLNFPGPFARETILLQDVERLNLLRRCEIHCVGLGEASRGALMRLAQMGMGKVRWLGQD